MRNVEKVRYFLADKFYRIGNSSADSRDFTISDSIPKSYDFTPCTFRRCTCSWSRPCRVSNRSPPARSSRRFASHWCSRARRALISGPCMASIDEARPSGSLRRRVPSIVPHGTAVSSGRRAAQFNTERYGECVTEFHAGWYTGELRQRRESSYD